MATAFQEKRRLQRPRTAALRLRGGRTMNARVISWHLIEDVLGWVAVLIVGVVMQV